MRGRERAAPQKMCYEPRGLRAGLERGRVLNFYKALFVAPRTDRVCNYVARAIYVAARRGGAGADTSDRLPRFRRQLGRPLSLCGPFFDTRHVVYTAKR